MLDVLYKAERELKQLLANEDGWNTVFINYHPPFVERLWRPWNGYRLNLHLIYPCKPEEALFHPHPWPSAMRVLEGEYEMIIGYGAGDTPPPVAAKLILGSGSVYEMTDENSWHYNGKA